MKRDKEFSFLIQKSNKQFLALLTLGAAFLLVFEFNIFHWNLENVWIGRLITIVFIGLYLAFIYSGWMIVVHPRSQTVSRVFSILKIPVGHKNILAWPLKEVFLIPKGVQLGSSFKAFTYSMGIGEFRSLKQKNSYEILKNEITSFEEAESSLRNMAKELQLPAHIYWSEVYDGKPTDSKSAAALDTPFILPIDSKFQTKKAT